MQDKGGVPREILRTGLCGALANSGERARLASVGTSYLAVVVVGENPPLQVALASPGAGNIPASSPSCPHATKL